KLRLCLSPPDTVTSKLLDPTGAPADAPDSRIEDPRSHAPHRDAPDALPGAAGDPTLDPRRPTLRGPLFDVRGGRVSLLGGDCRSEWGRPAGRRGHARRR